MPVPAVSCCPTSGVVSLTVGSAVLATGAPVGTTSGCGTAVDAARVAPTTTALTAFAVVCPTPS